MDSRPSIFVQKAINDVIFEAEAGKYQTDQTYPSASSTSFHPHHHGYLNQTFQNHVLPVHSSYTSASPSTFSYSSPAYSTFLSSSSTHYIESSNTTNTLGSFNFKVVCILCLLFVTIKQQLLLNNSINK